MSKHVKEDGLQAAVVRAVRKRWPASWIFHPVGHPWQESGIPDLLICIKGLLFALELKHQKAHETRMQARARTEPLQRIQLRRLKQAGATAHTVISVEEAITIIERGLREKS